ncbi:C4-dicarboxylate ABC transporter permease [Acuticoccus sediminis]|uniref:TRAP transporter small permease protein n=1 Tax=Acuticoccus sediminis TaxID=2184697 RepID=A0A8B2NL23_9HYPH|nr:TRAP transporter small permease [Acuticoccus sediminis]RAI00305.1 C4-dicarboxylate ABC transporter permease [Acuticoccus sediminis]
MSETEREDIDLAATSEGTGRAVLPEAGVMGRVIDRLGYVFAAGIVAGAVILLIEVFLRYVFNSPTIWAHETTIFLSGLAFIYGGLYCTARNSHIRVVLIYDQLGPTARRAADVVIFLVSAVASLFFAYAAYQMASRAVFAPTGGIRLETTGSAWSPPTPALIKSFIFITMLLLAIQFVILAINTIRRTTR